MQSRSTRRTLRESFYSELGGSNLVRLIGSIMITRNVI